MTPRTTTGAAELGQRRTHEPHGRRRPAAAEGNGPAAVPQESPVAFVLLHGLTELLKHWGGNLEAMLRGVAELLPPTSRYPDICCARLVLGDSIYATANWRDSPWKMTGEIRVREQPVGALEQAYFEPRPQADHGPFTHEERTAFDFMSTLVGKTVERLEALQQLRDTVRQLELERGALQQANTTLHGILGRIEEERNTVRSTITANVDKVLMPMLRELETRAEPRMRGMLEVLRKSLEEIASPFVERLARTFASLTPLEIGICRMIRDNLTTKEIARIRHVSPATVARQREHIRAKLGIARSDANLATYLHTFLVEKENG